MEDSIFLDSINIKTFPEFIIDYFKDEKIDSKFSNLRSFYSELLGTINYDIKNSYLNRILKYLSSKEESTILILEDIKDGIYEKELINFFRDLNDQMAQNPAYSFFYKNLLGKCAFLYFGKEELKQVEEAYSSQKFDLFLYLLFLHACKNYKINTPKITANRLFNDAICLFYDNELRYSLLKHAADLGNDLACMQYSELYYEDVETRMTYLMKGKNLVGNLWGVAFSIEHGDVPKQLLEGYKKELKSIIDEGDKYMQNINVINETDSYRKECTAISFKIYLYLAKEKNYTKAINSVGKFFIKEKVAYMNKNKIDQKKSAEVGLNYLLEAVRLGNIHAMQNIGSFIYNNNKNPNPIYTEVLKERKIFFDTNGKNADPIYKEMLRIGAESHDFLSSIYLTKILIDEGKLDEAEKYLQVTAKKNNGESLYRLGKIYETKLCEKEAIDYYNKAIANRYYAASIDLAKLYFSKYMTNFSSDNTKNGYLLLSINLLETYYNKYSAAEKKEADMLLANFKSII